MAVELYVYHSHKSVRLCAVWAAVPQSLWSPIELSFAMIKRMQKILFNTVKYTKLLVEYLFSILAHIIRIWTLNVTQLPQENSLR